MKKYKIDDKLIKNYIDTMNSLILPMNTIKTKIKEFDFRSKNMIAEKEAFHNKNVSYGEQYFEEILNFQFESIINLIININEETEKFQNERMNISIEVIRTIIKFNDGIICTRMIEPLNISRECLSILEKNNEIERIGRGIYISNKTFQDDFYLFQLKYKKVIFSHMNALYFHGMTEEIPYDYTVTVPTGYHDNKVNEKCNVFYANKEFYNLGVCELVTPNGNIVKAYDVERCICDIIRSKNRMDFEQVKKAVREYAKRKDKNLTNLSNYAKKMNISDEVMNFVGMYYE